MKIKCVGFIELGGRSWYNNFWADDALIGARYWDLLCFVARYFVDMLCVGCVFVSFLISGFIVGVLVLGFLNGGAVFYYFWSWVFSTANWWVFSFSWQGQRHCWTERFIWFHGGRHGGHWVLSSLCAQGLLLVGSLAACIPRLIMPCFDRFDLCNDYVEGG